MCMWKRKNLVGVNSLLLLHGIELRSLMFLAITFICEPSHCSKYENFQSLETWLLCLMVLPTSSQKDAACTSSPGVAGFSIVSLRLQLYHLFHMTAGNSAPAFLPPNAKGCLPLNPSDGSLLPSVPLTAASISWVLLIWVSRWAGGFSYQASQPPPCTTTRSRTTHLYVLATPHSWYQNVC